MGCALRLMNTKKCGYGQGLRLDENNRPYCALDFNSVITSYSIHYTKLYEFNSIDIGSLHAISKVFSIIFMYIGAAPGSTGGGIKVTTIAVIIMTVVSVLKNKEETTILKRKLDKSVIYKAMTIVMLSLGLIFVATLSILYSLKANSKVTGLNTLFEVVSAFATVGLSAGLTSMLNLFSEIILIFIMFLGRVGPIAVILSLTVNSADKTKNQVAPEGKIMVG